MQSLKLIITFCAAIFITTGLLANTEDAHVDDVPADSTVKQTSTVSAAQAVSLFNFISLKEEKKDSVKTSFNHSSSSSKQNQVIDFFDTIF